MLVSQLSLFMVLVAFAVLVKNLMYGFGDDRNPGSDTVNVMEEILIEFIVDVVCVLAQSFEGRF
jgi:hypothetical protein